MDFGALPPEINSARIYFGPGSGPMMAAAAGWDGLATELSSAATSYGSVVSGLAAGPWKGAASASMAAAAGPYVAWMNTAAVQAEQVANQARAAAAAYETAFTAVVPPQVIAANRALLMSLIATDILGQNTAAIAATEAHYGEMWAQDAAAMYSYAGSSAAAAALTPFAPPPQTANPTALAAQGIAVAQATGSSAATNTQAALSQVTSTVPTALQGLASPLLSASTTSSESPLSSLSSLTPGLSVTSSVGYLSSSLLSNANQLKNLMPAVSAASTAPAVAEGLGSGVGALGTAGPGGLASLGGGTGAAVSAEMGRAASMGPLSVPHGWGAAVPAVSPAATALAGTTPGAVPDSLAANPGGMLGGLPLAGSAPRGVPGGVPDARFLERPPMVPSWSTVG